MLMNCVAVLFVYVGLDSPRATRVYNNVGVRLSDNADVCDCMVVDCPGCHWPCPRCSSPKCGAECRNNRCWFYTEAVTDGSRTKIVSDLFLKPRSNASVTAAKLRTD